MGEWTHCGVGYTVHATEYYSAMGKKKILPFATRMDLKAIMLGDKIRQRQMVYDITYIQNLKK